MNENQTITIKTSPFVQPDKGKAVHYELSNNLYIAYIKIEDPNKDEKELSTRLNIEIKVETIDTWMHAYNIEGVVWGYSQIINYRLMVNRDIDTAVFEYGDCNLRLISEFKNLQREFKEIENFMDILNSKIIDFMEKDFDIIIDADGIKQRKIASK